MMGDNRDRSDDSRRWGFASDDQSRRQSGCRVGAQRSRVALADVRAQRMDQLTEGIGMKIEATAARRS